MDVYTDPNISVESYTSLVEEICDVWSEMFLTYRSLRKEHLDRVIDIKELGLDRFLKHAVEIMKHFEDLTDSLLENEDLSNEEKYENNIYVMEFIELLIDERLFNTLLGNLIELKHNDEREYRRQSIVFMLIFEVCQIKCEYYRKLIENCHVNEVKQFFDVHLQRNQQTYDRYWERMVTEFSDCVYTIEKCNELNPKNI